MDPPAVPTRSRVAALDGLRGLAVAGVLVFHLGFGWAQGGFLGVSAFFTLSGFFICSLLLDEHAATGRIDLRRFWSRRARRLLPAALVALVGILVFGATVATTRQAAGLRGDVFAALAYVANWRFLAGGRGYGDLFAAPSPVLHFWSLAIEEQCYLVFPLVVAAALAIGRGRRIAVAIALGLALAASVAALFVVHHPGADISRAYFGTDTRAAELLVGALLAVAVSGRARKPDAGGRRPALIGVGGGAALAGVLWSWHAVGLHAEVLYRGGLVVHALAMAVVIVAARAGGPFARVLALRPLRWLGRISYGAYLYHWPIFLWLTPLRTGLGVPAVSLVRLAATFAAAEVSVRLIEDPIRATRAVVRGAPRLAAAAMAALVVGAASLPVHVRPSAVDYTVAVAPPLPADEDPPAPAAPPAVVALASMPTPPAPPSESAPTEAAPLDIGSGEDTPVTAAPVAAPPPPTAFRRLRPDEAPRVYVAGDSVALVVGTELSRWGARHGMQVWPAGWFACAVARGGTYRYAGVPKEMAASCNEWATQRETDVRGIRPHVVVISYGVFDVLDRLLPGDPAWHHLGEPGYDDFVRREIGALTELMAAHRAHVVWVVQPDVEIGVTDDGTRPLVSFPESDPHRMDRFNELVRQVVDGHPGTSLVDLKSHLQTWPGGELDPRLRPDGVHPSPAGARDIAEWLGPQLAEIAAG